MIKRSIIFFTLILSVTLHSQEAIQQWVYNTLERAQLNVDKGNLEAAEKIYYDYATSTYSSKSYDHFVILRTYGYFLLQQDRNEEALKYLKLADQKRKMPPMDVFNLKFILGQIYYVEGQKEEAKKSFLEWIQIGEDNEFDLRPEGYATLATIYAQDADWDNALIYITLAIDNTAVFVENWAQLKFAIHIQKKQYMIALEVAQDLVRVKPKNKAYIEQMAGVYNIIKFEEESLASLEFKLQQDLLKKSSEYVNLANFYLFKGLPIDSSKVIKKGLALGVLDNNIKHNDYPLSFFKYKDNYYINVSTTIKSKHLLTNRETYLNLICINCKNKKEYKDKFKLHIYNNYNEIKQYFTQEETLMIE